MLLESLRRPSRYIQVGLVCVLLNNLIIIGLDQVGANYKFGVIAAFLSVTAAGYLLHAVYTFKAKPSFAGLFKFYGANLLALCWSMLLMYALCDGLGLRVSLAVLIVTALLFAWNYTAASWTVFKTER
jgi:putative flippase GtrA